MNGITDDPMHRLQSI